MRYVKCIENRSVSIELNGEYTEQLTIGKVYKMYGTKGVFYYIIDDRGHTNIFRKERFIDILSPEVSSLEIEIN